MKQGHASSNVYEPKTEPNSKGVDPGAVSEIGCHGGKSQPLYQGRGIEAPMKSETTHHCGSQGKH